METKYYNRYSYAELRARLDAPDCKQIDVDTIGAWMADYGTQYWNGLGYDADGVSIQPVIEYDTDTEQGEIVGYEIV